MRWCLMLAVLLGSAALVEAAEIRIWQDATANFQIEASLESVEEHDRGTILVLKRRDGKLVRVPLRKLSKKDQAYVKKQQPGAKVVPAGAGEGIDNASLPGHVTAPDGKLTLFADYEDVRDDRVVVYLVNRTAEPISLPAQDGDIYLKLEYKNEQGQWTRAQTHRYSWCINSYFPVPQLGSGEYFRLLGYYPAEGKQSEVRFRRYVGDGPRLVSNVGTGHVKTVDIEAAANDRMAINQGNFSFVKQVATGQRVLKQAEKDWVHPRRAAISTLTMPRFKTEDVLPVLKAIAENENEDEEIAKRARSALARVEKRAAEQKSLTPAP